MDRVDHFTVKRERERECKVIYWYNWYDLLQKRHRADDETNHREVEIFQEGSWKPVKWQDLSVGDIVKVYNNNFFPADLLLLSSR